MTARTRGIVVALALLGLGFAGASTWVHHQVLTDPSYTSFCDVNQTVSCTQVYLSRFGTVYGIPVAVGGVFWFGLVLLVASFSRPGSDAAPSYLFVLSSVGLAAVLYLGYASVVVLKHYCLLCIGTYVSVIGILIATAKARTIPMRTLPSRLIRDLGGLRRRPLALAMTLLFLAGTVMMLSAFQTPPPPPPAPPAQVAEFLRQWDAVPRVDPHVPAEGAKVLIVKFHDYECPHCKKAFLEMKPMLERFQRASPGAVRLVLKDFPLDQKCNSTVAQPFHKSACDAAVAVRIARDKGKAADMEDWLFANQETLTPDAVKYAVSRLLGVNDFDAQYTARIGEVKKDIAEAVALQVGKTPWFFVNGVSWDGWLPADLVEAGIAHELKKAGAIR